MEGDLRINGKDARTEWGVNMGDGFIENILIPSGVKPFVENESRKEHGKRVLVKDPRVEARDVTLMFYICGETEEEYMRNYKHFLDELQTGRVHVEIPRLGKEVYKLIYGKASSFAQNRSRTSSKLAVKFEEPNPADRE